MTYRTRSHSIFEKREGPKAIVSHSYLFLSAENSPRTLAVTFISDCLF